ASTLPTSATRSPRDAVCQVPSASGSASLCARSPAPPVPRHPAPGPLRRRFREGWCLKTLHQGDGTEAQVTWEDQQNMNRFGRP
ncbi:unnamed protein product, partial [Urochloa humidicola]